MRIAYITAGAAEMYCGSCLRDNTLAAALIAKGHDCLLIPTYTPIRTDERDVSLPRVFLGGINLYLQQKAALFRRMPGFLDRLLSRPGLLRWVSRFAVKTDAAELGALTVSMLKGTEGHQRREVLKLTRWLDHEVKPDIICLTNALLSGIVPELKRRIDVPIICTLQGDDIFIEWLPEPFKQQALALIRDNCRLMDGFITTCRYYKDFMTSYFGVPAERTHVIYPGINLNGYMSQESGVRSQGSGVRGQESALNVGYLARICPEKGLHLLVDAFDRLQHMPGVPPCRLRIAGYLGKRDLPYLENLRKLAEHQGWLDRLDYVGEVDLAGKAEFLRSLDVLSVPTTYREPKGLYLLEAWASGVPVVQPRHGSFPELIEATGGGLLVPPNDPVALAEGLRELLNDQQQRQQLGKQGQETVRRQFHAERMAAETVETFLIYKPLM